MRSDAHVAGAMRLLIGAEQTSVYAGDDRDAEPLAVLAIGTDRTAREFFRHDPPTPGEMENAIQAIEDAIMAARLQGAGGRNAAPGTSDRRPDRGSRRHGVEREFVRRRRCRRARVWPAVLARSRTPRRSR